MADSGEEKLSGRLYAHGSGFVCRKAGWRFRPSFYARFPDDGAYARVYVRTAAAAEEIIDLVDRLSAKRTNAAVALARVRARRAARKRVDRAIVPDEPLAYRGLKITRTRNPDKDGKLQFEVPRMGYLPSLVTAVRRINQRMEREHYIENRPTTNAAGFNWNLEK